MNTRLVSMSLAALLLLCSAVSFAGDYEDGLAAYDRGDYKTALTLITQAANKGDARAQNMLGVMYRDRQGVPLDYKQALVWFRTAADQGNAAAQHNLGFAYDSGQGVPQDFSQAVTWYRKAADQGYAAAQGNLGLMYFYGQGVTQDYVEAHKWINLAVANLTDKQLRDAAVTGRDMVAKKMTPAQIADAQKRASEWKKK